MTFLTFVVLAVMGLFCMGAAQEAATVRMPSAQVVAVLFASLSTVCGAGVVYLVLSPFLGR